ncbi:putative gibberellin regulated protein [Helianthus annuus]|nr:putative gibberellin regulated protein [Helianthus annuus]
MLSKRPHLCNRACGTCCGRCNCVPLGTSGNYEACACYAEMTTRGNKKKCP